MVHAHRGPRTPQRVCCHVKLRCKERKAVERHDPVPSPGFSADGVAHCKPQRLVQSASNGIGLGKLSGALFPTAVPQSVKSLYATHRCISASALRGGAYQMTARSRTCQRICLRERVGKCVCVTSFHHEYGRSTSGVPSEYLPSTFDSDIVIILSLGVMYARTYVQNLSA
jgi:hypothetical protein